MPARPEIFVSTTSKDLKTCRQLVRDALLTLGCVPVTQDHFAPDAQTVREMLRTRLAACDAVIHLAGECYGNEPFQRQPSELRRSYTQLEYDMARTLGKPVYTFLCAPDFPYDAHDPEPDELRRLQAAHRAALAGSDDLYVAVRDPQELNVRLRELQTRVETLARDLQKTRSWMGRGIGAAVLALLVVAGLLYTVKHEGEIGQARAEQRAAQLEQQLAALLQQQTRLTTLVTEKIDRGVPASGDAGSNDPATAAREETARQLGISVDALQRQLASEKTDVAVVLTRIDQGSAAADAKAAQWRKLRRDALVKLGDTEKAAGHYAAEIDPYRKALALIDADHEPLVWDDAAQRLEIALGDLGRYAEAEPLARELVEKRTRSQGRESAATLQSIGNLANLLRTKGDYAAAEPLYRRVLEAQERVLGPEHPDTLRSVNNLAGLLNAKADYAAAEPLYRRSLEAMERMLGPEHPDTLQSVNNLATLLDAKGDHTAAEALYRRCLEARDRLLGPEHPETLVTVSNLAQMLDAKGDYAAAEPLYLRAEKGMERVLPPEHPYRLDLDYYFSLMRQKQGRLAEALPLAEHAAEGASKTLPTTSPDRLMYEKNLRDLRAKLDNASPPP